MAKITLEVESNALDVFNKTTASMNHLVDGVNDFEKQGKDSFNTVAKAADGYTQKIKENATEQVNGVNKVINSRQKEKQEIAFLKSQIAEIIEYEKKLKELQENTAPGKVRSDLNLKLAETRFNLKEMQKELVTVEANEKKLTEPIVSLKAQLRKAKEELSSFEAGTDAFNEAAKKAGALEDQIKDASAASSAFAADSKAATAKTLFSQIGDDILQLDFKGAADKAKQFSAVMKTITFSETIGGVKSLGSALISLGKTLLTNPFFLLVAGIVAVGVAINGMIDSFKAGDATLKETRENLKEVTQATEDLARANRDLALENDILAGDISKSDGERLKNQNKFKDAYLKILQAQREETKKLNDGIQKEREEDGFRATKTLLESAGVETNLVKKQKIGLKEIEENYGKQIQKLREDFGLKDSKLRIEAGIQATKDAEKEKEKQLAEQKRLADELLRAKKDLADALMDLAKRATEAEISGLNGLEKLEAQKAQADKEVELLRKTIIEKQILAGKGNQLSAEAQEQFRQLELKNARAFADGLLQIEIEATKLLADEQEKGIDNQIKTFDTLQKLKIDAVILSRNPGGISDEDFEIIKQRKILEIQKQGLEDGVKLQIEAFEVEQLNKIAADEEQLLALKGKTDEISFIKRQALERDIASIKESTPIEIELINAENDVKIAALVENIEKKSDELKPDLLNWDKLLGVPAGTFDKAFGDIKSLTDSLFEFQQQQLDAELDVIKQRQELRDDEISDLQSQLDEENELRKQGLANNVDRINQEIEAKKAAGLADIELQKKIQEEKKKLAKAQLIIDTVIQASQLVTAIATTLNTYAAFPPLAAALVALQVGTFVVAKAQAFKAVNDNPANFAEGVIDLQGAGTETSDSIPANLSKGESVMTAQETRKNKQLFLGIRKNDPKLIEIGIAELLKNTGVSLPKSMVSELSATKDDIRSKEIKIMMPKSDTGQENKFKTMESHMLELVNQGKNQRFIDSEGNQIVRRGSLTQIIRKK